MKPMLLLRPLIDTLNEPKKNEIKNKQMKNKLISSSGVILIQFLDIIRIGIQKLRLFRVLESVQIDSRGLDGSDISNILDENKDKNETILEKTQKFIDLFSENNFNLKNHFLFHSANVMSSIEKNEKIEKKSLIEKLFNDRYEYMVKFPDSLISIFISAQDGFEVQTSKTSLKNTKLLFENRELDNSILSPISMKFSNPSLLKEYLFNVYLGSLLR
jgi:hypothetical protein